MLLGTLVGAAVWWGPGRLRTWAGTAATELSQAAYVAAAWPAVNAVALLDHPRAWLPRSTSTAPPPGAPTVSLVSWPDWTRRGIAWRYARVRARTQANRRLHQAMAVEIEAGAVGLLLLAGLVVWRVQTGLRRLRPSTALGPARLARLRDLRELRPAQHEDRLVLGTLRGQVVALRGEEQYQSGLIVGPPRAGKTAGILLTNLLLERGLRRGAAPARLLRRLQQCSHIRLLHGTLARLEGRVVAWRNRRVRSLIVTDLKGELTEKTYAALARHHRVLVLNLVNPQTSCGYNPLAHIHEPGDAQVFASCWIANTGVSREPFWDSAAKYLITAAVLHLNAAVPGGATLTHLHAFLTLGGERIGPELVASPDPHVRTAMSGFFADLEKNDKLKGSIFVELPLRFQLLTNRRVQATTSCDEIDVAALVDPRQPPTALYLVLDRRLVGELKPLLATFFSQLFHELIAIADASPGGVLPRPVLGYLDEFGNIGQIYNFATWMTTIRSAGMGFLLAVQHTAQLAAHYGEEGKAIIMGACNAKVALANTTAEDARWFSEQSGTQTTLAANAGASRKRGQVLADHGNRGYSETSKPLVTPGEVTRMRADQFLLLSANRPPALLRQRRYYQVRALRRLSRRRLPGGRVVPPGGPPRAVPLTPPVATFTVTAAAPPALPAGAPVTAPAAPPQVPATTTPGDQPITITPEDLNLLLQSITFTRQHTPSLSRAEDAALPQEDVLAGLDAEDRAVVRRLLAEATPRSGAVVSAAERNRP
jgi:type IV secretory pathway TraG/TraD family ATPase VirD4